MKNIHRYESNDTQEAGQQTMEKPVSIASELSVDSHLRFMALMMGPLLEETTLPDEIRISLEVDGEAKADELHVHIEYSDFSPLIIVEVPEAAEFTKLACLDERSQKDFLGIMAKNLQTAFQNDQMAEPEKGKKNSKASWEERKKIINTVIESLLKKAAER